MRQAEPHASCGSMHFSQHAPPTGRLLGPSKSAMHLSDLKSLHISQLLDIAYALEIDNAQRMRKQELMFAILKKKAKSG